MRALAASSDRRRVPSWAGAVAALLAACRFVVLQVAAFAASTDRVQSLQGERFLRQGLLTTLL